MNEVIIDAALRARLNNLEGLLKIRDESGRTLGYFYPVEGPGCEEEVPIRSPFSQEDLERRRQDRSGRPLDEILDGLSRS
jgi:hypothetical protein